MKIFFKISFAALIIIGAVACQKTAGSGGTSSITGKVTGQNHDAARNEITEIIVSNGSQLEHGDYFILNTPNNGTYYYVWYKNPTWVSNGDPQLSGRTGIQVVFNYSNTNTTIATATAAAMLAVLGNDFDVTVNNDILVITNKINGYTPDANNMNSPFEFNIEQQGKDSKLSAVAPRVDERVYIQYGDNEAYNETVRTGGDGEFSFLNLKKGNYTIYSLSEDTIITNAYIKKSVTLEITANKSVVDAGSFNVVY